MDEYKSADQIPLDKAIEAIMTDRWGHNIATTSQTQDFMQGDEAWWQTAAANGTTPPNAEFDDWSKQVVLTMASAVRDPATQQAIGVLKRSMELYKGIMFGPSGLSRQERELLAVVVSRQNDCHY